MPSNKRLEEPLTGAGVTRRSMLGSLAATSVARAQSPAPSRPRPTFLFILADDHAGDGRGCEGNPGATTPNRERGAAEGTRFSAQQGKAPGGTPARQAGGT